MLTIKWKSHFVLWEAPDRISFTLRAQNTDMVSVQKPCPNLNRAHKGKLLSKEGNFSIG